MRTYLASVKKAFSSQWTLMGPPEHCSADPAKLAAMGRAIGQQIRVKRNDNQYALYTVSEDPEETPKTIVRMAQGGRERLGTGQEFSATVSAQVPHPMYTDAQAEANNEFVERLTDDGTHTGLIVIAPHGGKIEIHTDQQAERVTASLTGHGVSSWRCKGWKAGGGASQRWHITSTDIHEASFPLLGQVIARGFNFAVAFHGFSELDILIGGLAPTALKQEVKSAIQAAVEGSDINVRIAEPGEPFSGNEPLNIVNRLSANGVQIEQSREARQDYWREIADAVASVYETSI